MTQLRTLKSATTIGDLAILLGFKPQSLSYILYVKPSADKYRKFEIPKRGGGVRQICAPTDDLKLVQRRIADLLQNCVEEINKANKRSDEDEKPDRIAHAFKRRRSIITNAREHRNRRYVFNVDLKNFFGSINFGRIRGYFIADKNFNLHPNIATILAQIACFENSLPQGSPCSPVISNLIGHILDTHLIRLSKRVSCTYTRYADDLTFSTNKAVFPKEIAKSNGTEHVWFLGDELSHIIRKSGFESNLSKTRMQYGDSRQEVTGLVVNRKVNVRREYRHTVRAMVHRLFTTGSFNIETVTVDKNGTTALREIAGTPRQLQGMLGFIDGIDLYNQRINPKANDRRFLSSKELMYRRFLMFNEFYAASSPVILCEGKTDIVYITHAIRSLVKYYPRLAYVKADGTISINLRRFKYTPNTGRILGINGGTADLKNFINNYRSDIHKFKAPGMQYPVIVLVDNDSGASSLFSLVKNLTKKKFDPTEPYRRVVANLYLVPTPHTRCKYAIDD